MHAMRTQRVEPDQVRDMCWQTLPLSLSPFLCRWALSGRVVRGVASRRVAYGRTDTQESHVQLVCAMVAAGEHRRALDHVQALQAADGGVVPTLPMLSYVMRGVARQVRARAQLDASAILVPVASSRLASYGRVGEPRELAKFRGSSREALRVARPR